MPPPTRARIDQTARALLCLQRDFGAWIDGWTARDQLRQYQTQLLGLRDVLNRALAWLEARLDKLDATAEVGAAFRECRRLDSGLMVVRRVWHYYRDKFDQRKDPVLGPVLAAADEIVWSCYAQAFPGYPDPPAPSAPLPFFSPEATPLARPRSESPFVAPADDPPTRPRTDPPAEWRDTDDDLLAAFRGFLGKMPIPVIALPYSCAQSPWELVLLAHEVGHQVQFDLGPRKKQVTDFQDHLAKLDPRWKTRADEVFADVFSLYLVGPAGVRALAELEASDPAGMLRPRGRRFEYPPPLVRLAFLAGFADRLGLPTHGLLATFGAEPGRYPAALPAGADEKLWAAAQDELRQAVGAGAKDDPPLIAAVKGFAFERWLPGQTARPHWSGSLEKLCDYRTAEFQPTGFVAAWAKVLTGVTLPYEVNSLPAPRLIAAAAVNVWAELAASADPAARADGIARLKQNLLTTTVECRDPATRTTGGAVEFAALGDELERLLRTAEARAEG